MVCHHDLLWWINWLQFSHRRCSILHRSHVRVLCSQKLLERILRRMLVSLYAAFIDKTCFSLHDGSRCISYTEVQACPCIPLQCEERRSPLSCLLWDMLISWELVSHLFASSFFFPLIFYVISSVEQQSGVYSVFGFMPKVTQQHDSMICVFLCRKALHADIFVVLFCFWHSCRLFQRWR